MSLRVLWTTVPIGFDPADGTRIRLSLIASPRVTTPATTLGTSPLADWPGRVRSLGPLGLQVQGRADLLPATVTTAAPSSAVWQAMLPSTAKVAPPPPGVRRLRTTPDETYVQAADSLSAIYSAPSGGPPASLTATPEPDLATRAVAALGALTDPTAPPATTARALAALPSRTRATGPVRLDRLGGTDLAEAVQRLRDDGHDDLALALPIAAHVAALRTTVPKLDGSSKDVAAAPPAPLDGIPPLPQADVHQIVGLLLDHPALAVAVGLRVDVVVPLPATGLDGISLVRVVRANGTPLGNPPPADLDPHPQPWSRVRLQRSSRTLTMADAAEVRGGMLDLATTDPTRSYAVTTTDVSGLSAHLASVTTAPGEAVRLPVRRSAGLILAQRNRPSGVVEAALDGAVAHTAGVGNVDGAPVLTAADVTTGYRIDVSDGGGPFRSLMRRGARYRVGSGAGALTVTAPDPAVPGSDEGVAARSVAVQQADADGVPVLRVGEEIAQWTGWSLAAPRPGRTVTGEPEDEATTAAIGPEPIPGIPVTAEVTAEPQSLPRLRFGRRYRLRGRAVHLGGVSAPATSADTSQVTSEQHFRRLDVVPAPTLVHRRRNVEGESLTRLVVRSDDGTPVGEACERHVAAPKTPVQLAEWHGAFDAAFGPDSPERAAARAAMLAVARREAGSFLEHGPGVSVVTNDPGTVPPITLPPRRGLPLPNGAYIVHDTPTAPMPYLPDVPVGGAALTGLSGAGPALLPYAGSWPDVLPGRLVVRPGTGTTATATLKTESGRSVLHVDLPPGTERTVRLSSTVRADRVGHFEPGPDGTGDPTSGTDPRLTPGTELTLVHAVRKPVQAPTFAAPPTPVPKGEETGVVLSATVACHRESTARIDLVGTWTDTLDTGSGTVRAQSRTAVAGSVDVPLGAGPVPVSVVHHFGDTRARTVAYRAVASTRFAEYFPGRAAGPAGQRPGPAASVLVPNRSVPPEPDVHGVVPTFSSTRTVGTSGAVTCVRTAAGVRVLLRRPWNATGDGEQLGVVAFPDTATGNAAIAAGDGRLDLVSRWGSDPLEETSPKAPTHLTPGRFSRRDVATTKVVPLLDAAAQGSDGAKALSIVGHRVELDPSRDLWFSDVDVLVTESPWPFVRLALVRYQPSSMTGRSISRVVTTDFCQLPPSRAAVFRRVGAVGVKVVVRGAVTRNSTFTLRQECRVHQQGAAGIDIFSDSGVAVGPADGWVVKDVTAGETDLDVLVALVLDWDFAARPQGPDSGVVAGLRDGRVVVEERQNGLAVTGPGAASRVVYTETLERSVLGIETTSP
ncbi:MAG TPA: hypothetical protein VES95_02280 [Dermatophilaceae bacterium]|nr:hypothetical protein [Dermatophilaceae bacterium]